MMDIKNPEYFVAIADQKNMRKASEILYLSQPTLSYYLTKLEQDVGCPLFYRHKKELELTPAGQLYLEAALRTIHIRDEVYTEIARLNRESHLFVMTGSVWATDVLGWVLPHLHARFPNVQLETAMETARSEMILMQPSLSDNVADFCLCSYANEKPMNNCMEILSKEALYFAIPKTHPYIRQHPNATTIDAEEMVTKFQSDTYLISRTKSSLYEARKKIFSKYKASLPEHNCEINGLGLMNHMLEAGYGVAIVPQSAVNIGNHRKVSYLRILPEQYRYSVLWHRSNLENTPAQRYFLQLVHEYFQMPR